jgi:hypothetical protein
MPTKRRGHVTYAVLKRDTQKVLKLKRMTHGFVPDGWNFDPDKYEAVKVGPEVQPGMVRTEEGFAWPH